MVSSIVTVCLALVAAACATEVQQCPGRSVDNLSSKVELNPCVKQPCRLKLGTEQHISIDFTPESDITDVSNSVNADVFGVELPFVGVDGLSVCDKLFSESGEKSSCPLKAGTTYTYKDKFPILSFYPKIPVTVTWALRNGGKQLTCFKVQAHIK